MSLDTFSNLKTAVARWANRPNLAAGDLADFIALAESRMSVDLATRALESKQNATITAGVATLPSDVIEVLGLRVTGATLPDVEITSAERIEQLVQEAYTGDTIYGTFVGRTVELLPTTSGTLSVRAKCRVPALSDAAPTNWVLTNFPGVYLYGTLMEIADFLKDDGELTKWAQRYGDAIAKANGALVYRGQNSRAVVHGVR